MSCREGEVKISCFLLHPQKPDFIRMVVCVCMRVCKCVCGSGWPVSDPGAALLGRATDGLSFDPVGGPEPQPSRVPGNCVSAVPPLPRAGQSVTVAMAA